MKKKILYGVGGIFIPLILIGAFSSDSEKVLPENSQIINTSTTTITGVGTSTKVSESQGATTVPKEKTDGYTYYSVTDVVDGDTLKVNINGTITTLRLIGLDTPETLDPRKPVQCFGKEASNKAKELLLGQKIRIEKDSGQGELDKYGRTLAYIYRDDGLFYNKYMIQQGYAHEYTYNTPYKYQVDFKAAQKTAESQQLGLWSQSTCNGVTNQTEKVVTPTGTPQTSGKYYTSSASNTKYYAPESCEYWKTWSTSNLRSFNSLEELLKVYPSRALSPQCS